jgi:hypothetical protein
MNWKRGLFRAWMAVTVLWVAGVGFVAYTAYPWEYNPDPSWRPSKAAAAQLFDDLIMDTRPLVICNEPPKHLTESCWERTTFRGEILNRSKGAWPLAFIPPVVLFAFGTMGLWVARGFRR